MPTTITKMTTISLTPTITALKLALSRIPLTSIAVITSVMRMAMRSVYAPVVMKAPVDGSKSKGARARASGSCSPKMPMKFWK